MDNSKSVIEKLIEFAENSKREIAYNEIAFEGNALYGVTHHERYVYIPENKYESVFLAAYHNPKSINENNLYFGVFLLLNSYQTENLIIREKNIFDKFFLSNKNVIKTDTENFNKNFLIKGDAQTFTNKLNNIKLQSIISETFQLKEGLLIGLNSFKHDFIPTFKNKSSFGIYSIQKWIIDAEFIEKLFSTIEKIKNVLTTNQY